MPRSASPITRPRPTYGMAFPAATELDLANFNAEANHCDRSFRHRRSTALPLAQDHFVAEGKTYIPDRGPRRPWHRHQNPTGRVHDR